MNTIKCSWNSGNFTLSHEVQADEAATLELASKGLLWHMQRNREHDVVLGAFEKVGDKSVRRKGFKRGDVSYTPALATALQATYASLGEGDNATKVSTQVAEYLRDVADSKFTEEREIATRHESANDLEAWLEAKCKYTGETHGEDGEYDVAALRAIRAYKLEVLRANCAEL